jgi:hypothetical protein
LCKLCLRFFQLTETGELGQHGLLAARAAGQVHKPELAFVTAQLHLMVEQHVQAVLLNLKLATHKPALHQVYYTSIKNIIYEIIQATTMSKL